MSAPVASGATASVLRTETGTTPGSFGKGVDAIAIDGGVAVAWADRLLRLDATGAITGEHALPYRHSSDVRLAWNARTQRLAMAVIGWGSRRPTVEVAELDPAITDGGLRVDFVRGNNAYMSGPMNGLELAACGAGFLVMWRDDITHPRGTPICTDGEYCQSNDVHATRFDGPDGGRAEWILNRVPGEPQRRLTNPLAVPAPGGDTLDIGWTEQDFVGGMPDEGRRMLHRELIDCGCP
jgi:hypothetical protein